MGSPGDVSSTVCSSNRYAGFGGRSAGVLFLLRKQRKEKTALYAVASIWLS